jgi:hypothetical protein
MKTENEMTERLLTRGEVRDMLESCMGYGPACYTLRLWTEGDEPMLPRVLVPGRKRGFYCASKVRELLNCAMK